VKNSLMWSKLTLALLLAWSAANAVASEAPGVSPASESPVAAVAEDGPSSADRATGVVAQAPQLTRDGLTTLVAAVSENAAEWAPHELAAESIEEINGQKSFLKKVGHAISVNAKDAAHATSVNAKNAGHAVAVNAQHFPEAVAEAAKRYVEAQAVKANIGKTAVEWLSCVTAGGSSCGKAVVDSVKNYKQYRNALLVNASRITYQTCVNANQRSGGCRTSYNAIKAKFDKSLPRV